MLLVIKPTLTTLILRKRYNEVAANFRSPSEGVAEGGGWGEEFRHRPSERQRPSPPPCSSEQSNTKKFSFPFRRKSRARANREKQRKLFCGACRFPARRRGGLLGGFFPRRVVQRSEFSPR